MYERLISIDSDYAKLFSSTNISKQIYMFRYILLNIPIMLAEDIPGLIEKLEALGKKHKNIGVVYKHYPIMQNVLLSIMKETNLFTEDHIDAWRWVFDFITHYMTDITNTE